MRNKKKRMGAMAVLGLASAVAATSCGSSGPGPASASDTQTNNPASSLESYDPALNISPELYGPGYGEEEPSDNNESPLDNNPISFGLDTSENISAHDISGNLNEASDDDFSPKDNIAEPLYGPPGKNEATE